MKRNTWITKRGIIRLILAHTDLSKHVMRLKKRPSLITFTVENIRENRWGRVIVTRGSNAPIRLESAFEEIKNELAEVHGRDFRDI